MMQQTLQANFSVLLICKDITINFFFSPQKTGFILIPFPWESSQRKHCKGHPIGTLFFRSALCVTSLRIFHFTHSFISSAVNSVTASNLQAQSIERTKSLQYSTQLLTLHLIHKLGKANVPLLTLKKRDSQKLSPSLYQSEHLFVQFNTSSSKAPALSSPASLRICGLSFLKRTDLHESCSDAQNTFLSVAPICSPSILTAVIEICDLCTASVSQGLWKLDLPTAAAPRPILQYIMLSMVV